MVELEMHISAKSWSDNPETQEKTQMMELGIEIQQYILKGLVIDKSRNPKKELEAGGYIRETPKQRQMVELRRCLQMLHTS